MFPFSPVFFRLHQAGDRRRFEELRSAVPYLQRCDEIHAQLRDLARCENPLPVSEAEIQTRIQERLGQAPSDHFGVWAYYPWRNLAVHLLEENDFVQVRTARNLYKITREEQAALRGKRVGIIGLSVGQSAALALAQERVAGTLCLADFDTLELSNLNRIRTGVHHLGLPKTVITAREIAEIDPYLQVQCFHEGITPDNIAEFMDAEGGLDLLIEECDSLEIKVLARQEARKRGIPVVMDTSNRGMIDVERYDLDPAYPLLHGRIPENLTYEFLKSLATPAEKIPYILPMLGAEALSDRLKASMAEIGKTISTWPQLGSEVILGGAVCAHVARRILLGMPAPSGRTFVDLDRLFSSDD